MFLMIIPFFLKMQRGTCKFNSSMVGAKVSGYTKIQAKNVTAMQTAIQSYGPIAVAITVINSFQYYT
jgi:hypothetical protein